MPRKPAPAPRTLRICITHHGRTQAASRGFTEEQTKDAVVNGRESPQPHKGQKGGDISKFYRTFVDRSGYAPITKSLVAVCEVFSDRHVLLNVYRDPMKT